MEGEQGLMEEQEQKQLLTLVSNSLAGISVWEVFRETTIGSDHYPIAVEVNLSIEECYTGGVDKCFLKMQIGRHLGVLVNKKWKKLKLKEGLIRLIMIFVMQYCYPVYSKEGR